MTQWCSRQWSVFITLIFSSGSQQFFFNKFKILCHFDNAWIFLDNHNIKYDYEHTCSDLRGINNGLLSYDFYIMEYNLLIEFQGIQHERQTEYFGGEKQFEVQQEHDRRKRQYAQKHNINLLEIWHYDIGNIVKILDDYLNSLKLESVETTGVA